MPRLESHIHGAVSGSHLPISLVQGVGARQGTIHGFQTIKLVFKHFVIDCIKTLRDQHRALLATAELTKDNTSEGVI
jgi:hypothetical protein